MRPLVIVLLLAACGGGRSPAGHSPATSPGSHGLVPAQPTFVITARSVRDGVATLRGVLDAVDAADVGPELARVLGVNPLDPDALAGIGVDLDAPALVFSEDVNPTFVVHLKSDEQMNGFLEGQKQNGVRTQSVVSDGTEVFSAKIDSDVSISWAVEHDTLWVHFAFDKPDGFDWFEHSKHGQGSAAAARGAVGGWMDLQKVVAAIGRISGDKDPIACAKQLLAVHRVSFDVDVDPTRLTAHVGFDLGASADGLRAALLPPPPGWQTASANAPLEAQWNIDAAAAVAWVGPCIGDDDLGQELAARGLRTLRAFVRELDPDDKEGVGAISADLSSAAFIRSQLDDIPGRSAFESSRTFGIYKGKHLRVPMVTTADYVLTDQLVIAAMGDKVLETIGTGTAGAVPAFELAIRPQGLSADVWKFLLEQIDVDDAKRAAQRLLLWSELSIAGRLDGSTLTLTAHAARR